MSINERTFSRPFTADRDFGEQRISFDVPEFTGSTSAKLTIAFDGRAFRLDQAVRPAKKWILFVVPNEHLDVGYTDFVAKVAEVHSRVIDEAMQLIDEFPDFRFTLDGFWEAEQFQPDAAKRKRNDSTRWSATNALWCRRSTRVC